MPKLAMTTTMVLEVSFPAYLPLLRHCDECDCILRNVLIKCNDLAGQNFIHQSDLLKDILAYPAHIYRLDVLHGKFGTMLGKAVAPTS